MNDHLPFDPNIPVLTEVFEEAQAAAPVDVQTARKAAPPPDRGAMLEQRAIDSWTGPDWTLMERRVSERVLNQLQNRVDFVLEQQLRDCMEEVLTNAVEALTSEIRWGLQQTIETVVVRAVAQEVAHLQALKQ